MKVWVNQEVLTRALKRATLGSGPAMNPIHGLVKLEAKRGGKNEPDALVLSAVAGLLAINTSIKAKVDEPGVIAASIRDLTNAAGAMPSGGVALQVAGNRLRLQGSSGRKWSGATADPAQIQPVPEPVDLAWLRVPTNVARVGIERVSYATANMSDECRPFDGVRFEGEPSKLTAICISRYQCVTFEQLMPGVELKGKAWQAVIPSSSLQHFREVLDEADSEEQKFVDLYEDGRFLYVVGPSTLLVAALPVGEYPPYDIVLSNFPKQAYCTLPRLALIESIRACIMTRTSKLEPGAMFRLKGGSITLYRNDTDSDFSDTIELPAARPDLDMTFKAGLTLMLDLLKAADEDPEMVAGSDARAILVRTTGGYRSMLTLMNMEAREQPQAQVAPESVKAP